jgi:hypothetical protein
MTFDDYKFICFCNKINPNIIEACRDFVVNEERHFGRIGNVNDDLGFAELRDVTSKAASLKKVTDSIFMSTLDFDKLGRNITKIRTKQLIKKPNKSLMRYVLKSYYLHYHDL